MNNFDVYLTIEDDRWTAAIPDIAAVVERVKHTVIQELASNIDYLLIDKDFIVNLCLSDDHNVHKLNLEFRHIDKPTNVLSFANIDGEDFDDMLKYDTVVEMGDVIIAFETMQEQAKEQNVSFKEHFCHLWTHGLLHILGYDHIEESDRIEMERLEILILAQLNIKNPYQE